MSNYSILLYAEMISIFVLYTKLTSKSPLTLIYAIINLCVSLVLVLKIFNIYIGDILSYIDGICYIASLSMIWVLYFNKKR